MENAIPVTGKHIVREVVKTLRCLKCSHAWTKRRECLPAVCPKCKNPKWWLIKIPGVGRKPKKSVLS